MAKCKGDQHACWWSSILSLLAMVYKTIIHTTECTCTSVIARGCYLSSIVCHLLFAPPRYFVSVTTSPSQPWTASLYSALWRRTACLSDRPVPEHEGGKNSELLFLPHFIDFSLLPSLAGNIFWVDIWRDLRFSKGCTDLQRSPAMFCYIYAAYSFQKLRARALCQFT